MRDTTNESAVTRLRAVGLRPTRQRNELADLLFRDGHRHLTAETLHADAVSKGIRVSLATVYNTLHQFTNAGLLREVLFALLRSGCVNLHVHDFPCQETVTERPRASRPSRD